MTGRVNIFRLLLSIESSELLNSFINLCVTNVGTAGGRILQPNWLNIAVNLERSSFVR
jgi:hypothetical protein